MGSVIEEWSKKLTKITAEFDTLELVYILWDFEVLRQ